MALFTDNMAAIVNICSVHVYLKENDLFIKKKKLFLILRKRSLFKTKISLFISQRVSGHR